MADELKRVPGPVGRRLRALREALGLTAAQVASRSDELTPDIISNVENGRKRDLTATEVVQVAVALEVSPMALLVNVDEPWGRVDVPGLRRAADRRDLTVAEQVLEWGDGFGSRPGQIPRAVRDLAEHSTEAFVALRRFTAQAVALERANGDDLLSPATEWDLYVPEGTVAEKPHLEEIRELYRDALQAVVLARAARNWIMHYPDAKVADLPTRISTQIEELSEVVQDIAKFYEDAETPGLLDTADRMQVPDVFYTRVSVLDIDNGYVGDGEA